MANWMFEYGTSGSVGFCHPLRLYSTQLSGT